ncbi:MAG: hypothetical protein ACRC0L_00615, partial [Angustibacter sp.]
WLPTGPGVEHVQVNVFRESGGRRTVVSHFAKLTRGQLTRHLLERPGNPPRTARGLLSAVSEDFEAELTPPSRGNSSWQLHIRAAD